MNLWKLHWNTINMVRYSIFQQNNSQYFLKDTIYTDKVAVLIYSKPEEKGVLLGKVTDICSDEGHTKVLEETFLAISEDGPLGLQKVKEAS